MLAYEEWDKAINAALQSLRVPSLRVRALPKNASSTSVIDADVTWLFPEWKAIDAVSLAYKVEVSLLLTLYLDDRYEDGAAAQPNSIETIEGWIVSKLVGMRLPKALSPIAPESAKLFAPNRGKWYKELRFSFNAEIDLASPFTSSPLPVQQIQLGAVPNGGEVWRLP